VERRAGLEPATCGDQKSEGRIRYENDRFGGLDPYDDTRFSNLLISCRATLVLVRVRT